MRDTLRVFGGFWILAAGAGLIVGAVELSGGSAGAAWYFAGAVSALWMAAVSFGLGGVLEKLDGLRRGPASSFNADALRAVRVPRDKARDKPRPAVELDEADEEAMRHL